MTASSTTPLEAKARVFVSELAHGEWEHSHTTFDETMSGAMPAAKLHALWETLEAAGGPFRAVDATHLQTKDAFQIVLVTCAFERLRKVLRVVFDQDGKLTGLFYGPVPEDIEAKTRSLVVAAAHADFQLATRDFGDVMRNAFPPAKFAETWKEVERQSGAWQSVEQVTLKPENGLWSSRATCQFARGRLVVRVTYDAGDQVAGLFVEPPAAAATAWTAPPYVNTNAFAERDVTVGSAPALPGILTLPVTPRPAPAVILVHGSGPNDQDETVGGAKVFKDLAWGLGSRGVAVLRYVKRTRHAPAGVVTEKEEVLDAAHAAIELLRSTPEVDGARIFVLGHSQGGNLAPRIATENPALAGMIVLAGQTRPDQDVLIDQLAYFASLDPKNAELAEHVDAARTFKRTVEDPKLGADQELLFPVGGATLKGAYFLYKRGYDAPTVAQKLSCRMLILQGERDYQVTMKDFAGWRRTLADKAGATLKTYPSLNHLFVTGSGTPSPAEYQRPGHVDDAVVDDIAKWIGAGGHP